MRQTSSSGSVLLMVVIISAILYLMAATLLFLTSLEVHLADFEQRSTQAFYVAESSIAYGLAKLRTETNFRTETTDVFYGLGGNLASMTAQFCDGTDDGNGIYRQSLAPSLYHIILRGTGTVTGFSADTKRIVERDVTLKPFAVFAHQTVTLRDGCHVTGNIHANGNVILESGSIVKGDVTSAVFIQEGGVITPPGIASNEEPAIAFPALDSALYQPRYWYEGEEYSAQSLTYTPHVTLSEGAPFELIDVYSGDRSDENNPAGIFYVDAPLVGEHNALIVTGTVIVRSPGVFTINGAVTITPLAPFPAVISDAEKLQIQYYSGLENFLENFPKNSIQGLVYSPNDITIERMGADLTDTLTITGSVFGGDVTLSNVTIEYTPDIIADPPPGLDLIELGAWREVLPE